MEFELQVLISLSRGLLSGVYPFQLILPLKFNIFSAQNSYNIHLFPHKE
jgi:hypothetical protein